MLATGVQQKLGDSQQNQSERSSHEGTAEKGSKETVRKVEDVQAQIPVNRLVANIKVLATLKVFPIS